MSKKTVPEGEAVVSEVVDDTPTPVRTQKRDIYCLLINEEVSVKNVPVGGWFVKYTDFKTCESWGPIPLMTPTRKGQAQFTGYVGLDDLRATAEYQWEHDLEHGYVLVEAIGLDLSSGSNKMMSVWLVR